jgi:hypothetical protein
MLLDMGLITAYARQQAGGTSSLVLLVWVLRRQGEKYEKAYKKGGMMAQEHGVLRME